jgi:hypothetical protein
LQQQVQAHHEKVNWDLVSNLARNPRGVPVAITEPGASLEQTLAAATRVQNVLPEGSTWNGRTDLPMDEASFRQIVSEIEPGAPTPGAPAATSGTPSAAGRTGKTQPAPKNGG